MAHNGHPNMGALGITGGRGNHLMNLADAEKGGLQTNNLNTQTETQQFNVKDSLNKAKKAVTPQNMKATKKTNTKDLEQANKVGGSTKSLDDLIKEYGMEAEAAAVNTGEWAMPYGNFYVDQYEGFAE